MTFKIPTLAEAQDAMKQLGTAPVVIPNAVSFLSLSIITLNPALCFVAVVVTSYVSLLWAKVSK